MRADAAHTALACALLVVFLAACDPAEVTSGSASAEAVLLGEVTSGARVAGTDWAWIPVAGMTCRSGSGTGFGLRRAPADASPEAGRKLVLYLDSGGACFAPGRCRNSSPAYDADAFAATIAEYGQSGIFADRPDNPFHDWNAVYVPYCTGDVYIGDTTDVVVPGLEALGPQQFVGYRNMERLLDLIQGQARQATQVAFVGASGGGFGTIGLYGLVAERLAPAPVHLINDAGQLPPSDAVLTDSLQLLWREVWSLGAAAPDGCGTPCFQPSGDGFELALPYHAQAHPDRRFALISYTSDWITQYNFGYLNPNCVPSANGACIVPDALFRDGLLGIRASFASTPNAVTYFVEGSGHMSIRRDDFYALSVGGVPLNEWVGDVLTGSAGHVGPAPRD